MRKAVGERAETSKQRQPQKHTTQQRKPSNYHLTTGEQQREDGGRGTGRDEVNNSNHRPLQPNRDNLQSTTSRPGRNSVRKAVAEGAETSE